MRTRSTPTRTEEEPPFLWGVASSGFQSEGGRIDSNWQRYVDAAERGEEPYRAAVDFRHRYEEDIALARDLGANAFRFGVSWARVEPREGATDEVELAYYDDVVRAIVANGMTPIPTLHHFVIPGWVLDRGGWARPETVDAFVRYAAALAERWAKDARYWLVFNEPSCDIALQAKHGEIAFSELRAVAARYVEVQRRVYDAIHALRPDAMVSSNECTNNAPPVVSAAMEGPLLRRMYEERKVDFIGIDVYYRADAATAAACARNVTHPWDTPQQPCAMYEQITLYRARYPRLPLFITENGMPTDDGKPRPDGLTRAEHLRENIRYMQKARSEGIPVLGYLYWSLTDNYEWGSYRPRFGLYRVDASTDPTLRREPTDAVDAYRRIIAEARRSDVRGRAI